MKDWDKKADGEKLELLPLISLIFSAFFTTILNIQPVFLPLFPPVKWLLANNAQL